MHPRHTPDFPYDSFDPRGGRRRRDDFPEGDDPRRGRPDGRGRGQRPDGHGHGRGFGPGPRGGGRGRRAGRGEIRAAILLLLAEQPMHGYQVITELSDRTDGGWRPSPGAVYPAIAQLQDEGLVSVAEDGGRRLASLTDAGRAHVDEHRAELGNPWETFTADPRRHGHELHGAMRALGGAVEQVLRTGTAEQAQATVAAVDRARREIYLLLAGADDDTPTAG